MHGRVFFSLALLMAAGCQSGDPITADTNRDAAVQELGDGAPGIYVLRSIAGVPVPAVLVSHESYHAVMTADTIFLHADGTGATSSTKRVTEEVPAGERTAREQTGFTYKLTGSRLTAEIPCPPLASCLAPPHYTGTIGSAALELDFALNYRVPMRYAKVAGPSDVAGVRITPSTNLSVVGSATLQLSATAVDAQGRSLSGRAPSWSALAPSVATVTSEGVVQGVAEGTALVSAFIGGRADTVTVRVER